MRWLTFNNGARHEILGLTAFLAPREDKKKRKTGKNKNFVHSISVNQDWPIRVLNRSAVMVRS